ncbi:MAG: MFS transporter [Vulcanococcus sp.]|uniref:MFS transporter n=1 Tax=Vulcanococcus sp. TaxID=2856995 RepID=UPI0025FA1CAB|nr:MFS transporter [Vulcanococcus sp.]MBW0182090.1 MFS transporter [Vulcanococcus sp.]
MSETRTRALAVPFLGVLASLQLIDPTVANTALVKASQALEMNGATLALAAGISTLAQAATVLLMGFLGDRLERRRVLMAALLLSVAGDGIALAAPNANLFLLGRALAGIAVGGVLVLSFAAVRCVSRPNQLGKDLGVWNLLILAGFIAGSLLGGVLANSSWRLALGLVPLIALLCLPLLPSLLPEMPANPELRADWRGLVSISGAMVLFLSGVSHAINGLTSPEFLVPTLSGVVLFGVHGLIEQRRQQPIFPISLYQRGCFSAAIVSGIAFNFAWAVVQLQTSNFWQLVQRYSTGQVALAQLPLLVSAGVGVVVAGRVMRPGRRITQLVAAGMASLVIGLLLFGLVRANSSYSSLGFAMVLVGIGLGLISVPQAALFVQEAPPRSLGSVTAFRTTAGQLGFALGFASSGAMVNTFGFASLRDRMLQLGSTPVQSHQLESLLRETLSGGRLSQHNDAGSNAIQVMSEAYASGLAGTMVGVALIVCLLGAISLLLLVIGHRQQHPLGQPTNQEQS